MRELSELSDTRTLTLKQAKEHFFLLLRVEGRSWATLEFYRHGLESFERWLGRSDISLAEINTRLIREYLVSLQERGLKKTSIRDYGVVLKRFFGFLEKERLHLGPNPMELIKLPKIPKRFPKTLTDFQIEALLKAAKARGHTWAGLRDYCLVLMLIDCGLRLKEIINLRLEDVSLVNRALQVSGSKSDTSTRVVYMGRRLARVLRDWLARRGLASHEDTVFITHRGYRLQSRAVQRMIARLAKRAGIEGVQVSPHVFRHYFAVSFLRNGGDVASLMHLLGHSDLKSTNIYLALAQSSLREAHARASPVDKLLGG